MEQRARHLASTQEEISVMRHPAYWVPANVLTLVSILVCFGCEPSSIETGEKPHQHVDHDGHDHENGPHGGHLIELGVEEYHAEWLHDDETNTVTVYILDADARNEFPIEAAEISINVKVNDQPKQYKLTALHTEQGKSSQFQLVDDSLMVALSVGEGVSARLRVDINGTPFSASIEHHAHHH